MTNISDRLKGAKLFYSIGEVADIFGEPISTIRYWTEQFPSLKPRRARSGDRQYTQKDLEEIERIQYLVKKSGMKIDGARRKIDAAEKLGTGMRVDATDDTATIALKAEVVSRLEEIRAILMSVQDNL